MPCFVMQIRKLRVKMPEKVSLFEDGEEIERRLRERLDAKTHEELHQKIDAMEKEELKEILEEVLDEINAEKQESKAPPDRLKEQRKTAKEMWVAVNV